MNTRKTKADGKGNMVEINFDRTKNSYVLKQAENEIILQNTDIDKLVDFVIETEEKEAKNERAN